MIIRKIGPQALLLGAMCCFAGGGAQAAVIELYESGIKIDADVTSIGSGAGVNDSLFDYSTGLGSLSLTIGGTGAHSVDLWVNHHVDKPTNSHFNETGSATGTLAAGQSWEIDEPGYGNNSDYYGDIFDGFGTGNFQQSTLDNLNNYDAIDAWNNPENFDDVSMALGWDFSLLAGQSAIISFLIGEIVPTTGFYLTHSDPDSNANIYFSSSMQIQGGGDVGVPEPASLALVGIGALLLGVAGRRRRVTLG